MKNIEVVYFAPVTLIDNSIELIKIISEISYINIHIIIIVSLASPNHTIFKINKDKVKNGLYKFSDAKHFIDSPEIFESYFKSCKSINVMFYNSRLNMTLLKENFKLLKLINVIKPDIIHFDDAAGRLSLLILMLFHGNIILNVHDPIPHSGEYKLLTILRNFVYKKIKVFITFSNYSKQLLKKNYQIDGTILDLKLLPYKSYLMNTSIEVKKLIKNKNDFIILFYGRISKYKNIELLLSSFELLSKNNKDIKLVIAGKKNYDLIIPDITLENCNFIYIDRYIENGEVIDLLGKADIIVCPYIDSTQSGVLMTADVFNLPILASNTGSFSEYIVDGKNGFLLNELSAESLMSSLENFIKEKNYYIFSTNSSDYYKYNEQKIVDLYISLSYK